MSIILKHENRCVRFNEINGTPEGYYHDREFVPFEGRLWTVVSIDNGQKKEFNIADMQSFSSEYRDGDLYLRWESPMISVEVKAYFQNDFLRMNISTKILQNGCYINKVLFPVLDNLKLTEAGEEDNLLLPYQIGFIIKNPIKNLLNKTEEPVFYLGRGGGFYENEYPAGYSYQFSAYYNTQKYGYYLSTEDPDAYIKTVGYYFNPINNSMSYIITNYPHEMNKTADYATPYDFVFKIFEGDWQTAAQIYRPWAIQQKWCREPLAERNLPESLSKTDLWIINHTNYSLGTRREEYFNSVTGVSKKTGADVGIHWYGWNNGEHDVNYPDYISKKRFEESYDKELLELNKRFDENGIVKIPYLNARLWDVLGESWDETVAQSALKNEGLKLYDEPWKNGTLKPMCPASELWHNTVVGFADKFINKFGFDGSYIDQVGSFNATLCFDENHNHSVGGGSWWNDSYHNILNKIRVSIGNDKILTTESCCETYSDVFDMMLNLDQNYQGSIWTFYGYVGLENTEAIPLYMMIYGNHCQSYGSVCRFTDSLPVFELNIMRNLIWGNIPTIECPTGEEYANGDEYLAVIKKAVNFWKLNKESLFYGRPVKEIHVNDNTIDILWILENGVKTNKKYPAILAYEWCDKNDNSFVIGYNYADFEETLDINGSTVTIKPKSFFKI